MNSESHVTGTVATGQETLTVVVPAHNEAASLSLTVEDIIKHTPEYLKCEVIIVNDGSADLTTAVMSALVEKFPNQVRAINHKKQQGMGAALATGFQTSSGQILTWLPGDGEYQFSDVAAHLDKLKDNDIVLFRRTSRGQLHRGLVSAIMHALIKFLFSSDLRDYSGIFLVPAETWAEVRPGTLSTLYGVEVALAAHMSGRQVTWATVEWIPRRTGKSSVFRFAVIVSSLRDLATMRRRIKNERCEIRNSP